MDDWRSVKQFHFKYAYKKKEIYRGKLSKLMRLQSAWSRNYSPYEENKYIGSELINVLVDKRP